MKRNEGLGLWLALLGTLGCWLGWPRDTAAGAPKPNFVVILSDDQGYGSAGCYGDNKLETPHIDRLAREGRRFTNAYAPGSVCSPTRYGLMTGRYYWRTDIKEGKVLGGTSPLHIETDRMTLASLCKSQGYQTAAIGKWHLGIGSDPKRKDWSGTLAPGPLEVGFDYFFGIATNPWSGPQSYIENHQVLGAIPGQPILVDSNKPGSKTSGIEKQWVEEEIMKDITARATRWIADQDKDKPFFLYFAPNAIHRPVTPNAKFSGSPYGVYGDFITELDWSVGEVLHALEEKGVADNTLVIFTSDNGGVINQRFEEVVTATKNGLSMNGNLRGGKHDVWEGGFKVPFIARWPGKIPADTVSDQVICLTDVLATYADILHVPLPKGAGEDSVDILPALEEPTPKPGATDLVRDHVVLQSADGIYAIRMGNLKLIERVDAPPIEWTTPRAKKLAAAREKRNPKYDELFELDVDPGETTSQHTKHAVQSQAMKQRLRAARDQGQTREAAP